MLQVDYTNAGVEELTQTTEAMQGLFSIFTCPKPSVTNFVILYYFCKYKSVIP